MFFKRIKNKIFLLIMLLLIPYQVYSYSDYIYAGGENIGIELKSSGVIIVGTYEVEGKNPAKEAKLVNGDKIIEINNIKINSIKEMINVISNSNDQNKINITYERNNNILSTTLTLKKDDNNVFKTGLYVKDSINGVGTLTFIDPNTKIYGALGHQIIESTTGKKLEIKDGLIYNSTVTSIRKSTNGNPGEKNADYNIDEIYGNVSENTTSGIFGKYTANIPNKKLYKVGKYEDINLGDAKILTVINEEEIKEFDIKIIKLNNNKSSIKNILFEITDKYLLDKTGGIVQGMSGSPIIQNDLIIGAVTHVVVDDTSKGYGILITTMLEEAEN